MLIKEMLELVQFKSAEERRQFFSLVAKKIIQGIAEKQAVEEAFKEIFGNQQIIKDL